MAALTSLYAPSPSEMKVARITYKVAASQKLWGGGMLCRNAGGFVVPASDSVGLSPVVGKTFRAGGYYVDNTTGADGALTVSAEISHGVEGLTWYLYDNDTGSPVVQGDLDSDVMVIDDHTVGHASSHSIVAGKFRGFLKDAAGADITSKVWIEFAV